MPDTKREMAFEIYCRMVAQALFVDTNFNEHDFSVPPGQHKVYPEMARMAFAAADAFEKAAGR